MEYKLKGGMPGMPQLPPAAPYFLIVPGVGMMGFGVLVILTPQILVWIVAGLFLLIGALLTLAGLRAKRMLG